MTISLPNSRQLLDAINPENLLGKGSCYSVYCLDSYPNLVFRHFGYPPKNYAKDLLNLPILPLKEEEIDTRMNYGQPVARVGNRDTINLKVPGEVLAHLSSPDDLSNYKRKLFILAALPQKSYDQLCDDALYLIRKKMGIDAVVMNMFLDEKQQKFYFVDVEPVGGDNFQKMDNGISGIAAVCSLSQKNYLIRELSSQEKQKAKIATSTILSKVLKAAQKKGLGFSNSESAEENLNYIAKTMDYLKFSQKEKDQILHRLLVGGICPHQILGRLSLRNEK